MLVNDVAVELLDFFLVYLVLLFDYVNFVVVLFEAGGE
jgi:hypothetical protein